MRIGIEVQNMFRPKKQGADLIVLELLNQLQQQPIKHELFVYAQGYKHCSTVSATQNTQINVSGPASANVWEQQLLPEAIRDHRINLLHCTGNTAPVNLKVPLILTIHDVNYLEKSTLRFGSWYQRFEHLYAQWNVPKIARMADLIVTVSNYERERIIETLHVSPLKVQTVYHAFAPHFNTSHNNQALTDCRNKYQLPQNFILYFGSADPNRNMVNVLKALNILYKSGRLAHKLVIAGISTATLHHFLTLTGLAHLEAFIHLTGYIPNNELPYIYKMASLFLYPTLNESFGLPMLEAMACGVPVIASNCGAIPEIAGPGALLFNANDPGSIADIIHLVLYNSAVSKETVASGLKRTEFFNWHKTTSKMLAIYEQFTD